MIAIYAAGILGVIVLATIAGGMVARDIRIAKKSTIHSTKIIALILPYIPFPSTLSELADTYMIIINAPFAEAREGFGRAIMTSLYPTMCHHAAWRHNYKDTLYNTACRLVALAHISVFITCFGLAVLLHQPDYIIAYLSAFCAWTAWTIGRYPHISWTQKIMLIVLLPSMAGYFFYRLSSAPVRGLTRTTL